MEQFSATASSVMDKTQRSIANHRYSGLNLINLVANTVTRSAVFYFPVLQERIINIGVYEKYFVLVYAEKASHVVVDVKRMNTDGTLLRYVMDMMVFFMCLPFVGFPSMSAMDVSASASIVWEGISNKKNGRRAPPNHVYDKDLSLKLIPLHKQLEFNDIIVMASFSSSTWGADGTVWCDVREGIMPLLEPLPQQLQIGVPGGLIQEPPPPYSLCQQDLQQFGVPGGLIQEPPLAFIPPPYQLEQQDQQLQQFGGFQQQMNPTDTIPTVNVDEFDILDSLNQQQLNSLWSVA